MNSCVLTVLAIFFITLNASMIRMKRGYDDNFNVLLNLYKMNPLKQSNVFKSFSDRILLPRPGPDSNYNVKESGEEKKVNTNRTKEINSTTNFSDDRNISNKIKEDNIKITLSIQKQLEDKDVNDSQLIHDLNIKLDTMSAEIMNILDLLQDNKTQTKRPEIKNFNQVLNYGRKEKVENKTNINSNSDDRLQNLAQNEKITERVENKNPDSPRDDELHKQNVAIDKIPNYDKSSLDSLNYIPENTLHKQYFAQNGNFAENKKNELKHGNSTVPASVPEMKFYSEDYLKNTIFYDDYFDNDRAYKVQDNVIIDKDKYVNAEVVIF